MRSGRDPEGAKEMKNRESGRRKQERNQERGSKMRSGRDPRGA